MLDLVKGVVSKAVGLAKANPLISGLGLAALVLPKLMGTSPAAMMGAQSAIGNRLPPQGMPPQGMPPSSPGSF